MFQKPESMVMEWHFSEKSYLEIFTYSSSFITNNIHILVEMGLSHFEMNEFWLGDLRAKKQVSIAGTSNYAHSHNGT